MNNLSGVPSRFAIELACNLSEDTQGRLMELVTEAARNNGQSPDVDKLFKLSDTLNLKTGQLLDIIGLYLYVIRVFMEVDVKQFSSTMITVGFPETFIEYFMSRYSTKSITLNAIGVSVSQRYFSAMWRLDISITNSMPNIPIPPKIIFSLVLNNGQKYIFEIDIPTFNRLRFNIALAFKEFNSLKKSNVLKKKIM